MKPKARPLHKMFFSLTLSLSASYWQIVAVTRNALINLTSHLLMYKMNLTWDRFARPSRGSARTSTSAPTSLPSPSTGDSPIQPPTTFYSRKAWSAASCHPNGLCCPYNPLARFPYDNMGVRNGRMGA